MNMSSTIFLSNRKFAHLCLIVGVNYNNVVLILK